MPLDERRLPRLFRLKAILGEVRASQFSVNDAEMVVDIRMVGQEGLGLA
jgi:hypothetical protein